MSLSAVEALGRLLRMGKTVLTTGDAALHLRISRSAATRSLGRLAAAGLVLPLRHGLWSLDRRIDPLLLPEHLTAPFPSYVSLLSALNLHGMISQIPRVVFVASLAPTRRLDTRVGVFSVHRVAPRFFGGFETTPSGVRLATPEKALLDTLYLAPARSRLFASLPEIEIPRGFSHRIAGRWIARIPAGPRKIAVEQRLAALLARRPSGRAALPRRRSPRREED